VMCVLLFACISVCMTVHISQKPHDLTSLNLLCTLAWSFSGGVAICYALPVLRMSCYQQRAAWHATCMLITRHWLTAVVVGLELSCTARPAYTSLAVIMHMHKTKNPYRKVYILRNSNLHEVTTVLSRAML